ncbi:MAG: hypothetical protein U5L96_07965 [Owenweeksia sp.]|nr:hypothetical protein [Owenweeksia sp.]
MKKQPLKIVVFLTFLFLLQFESEAQLVISQITNWREELDATDLYP